MVRQTHQPGEVAAVVFVVAVCVAAAFWFLGGLFHGRRPADGAATRDVPEERGQLAAYWSLVDEIEGLVREVVVLDREKKPATGPYNLALERYAVAIQIRFEANAHLEDRLRRGWGSDWMGEREALLVLGALARGERRTP